MGKYIIKRLLNGLIVLLGVVTITFFITRVVPSDVAGKWAGERATEEQRQQAIAELGLDKPLATQYVNYLKDLLSGDLGRSLRTKELITKELASYFPATMELVLVGFLFALFVGIPMGIYSAKKTGKCWIMPPASSQSARFHCQHSGWQWCFSWSFTASSTGFRLAGA